MKRNIKLARLTICQCGFPVLCDHIKIGHEYVVWPDVQDSFDYTCGGCGIKQKVIGIYVEGNGGPGGFLPVGIFDLEPVPEDISKN